jgi:hypothetical protein
MKQFYLLFVVLAALMCSSVNTYAQTYTNADYTVRVTSDEYITLDDPTTHYTAPMYYDYFYGYSPQITIPFNIRYYNIITNKVRMHSNGDLFVARDASFSNFPDNCYPYAICYSGYAYSTGTIACPWVNPYGYAYNYYYYTYYSAVGGPETMSGQYMYSPAYAMFPWHGGYSYTAANYSTTNPTTIRTQTFGTAPNRQFVVEALNLYTTFYFRSTTGSAQVVFFETPTSIPTRFQFRYNQPSNDEWGNPYNYASYYQRECGIKSTGGVNNFISINIGALPAAGTVLTNYGTSSTSQACRDYATFNIEHCTMPDDKAIEFAFYYNYNLAFELPGSSPFPPNAGIRLRDVPFQPTVKILNMGKLATTSASLRLQITRAGAPATILYDNTLPLSGTDLPTGLFTFGPSVPQSATPLFPQFTPTVYDEYTMTWSITSTTPTDQDPTNNTMVTKFIVSPANNIRAKAVLFPAPYPSRTPLGVPTGIQARFDNIGANNQTNVQVTAVIKNPQGVVVYRDTQTLNNWLTGQTRDTTFRDYTPTQKGLYTVCAIALLGSDQLHIDDTVCILMNVQYEADVKAVAVLDPEDDGEKPEGKPFQVKGIFENVGVRDLFDIRARVQIKRCSDGLLVYQADSLPGIPELNIDEGQKVFGFPTRQGTFDTRKLAPGCYKVCVISLLTDDVDRTNDTACTFFSVIPKLKGNIEVGVGRRFKTISAAVDSMRYRGIGGHLNLILTDANYTENGMTSVSTPWAAVDMTGIEGTDQGAIVTWKPKPNVFPTITFTGDKQYCINYSTVDFAKDAPDWMVWDGNNQVVPTADKVLPEPSKRAITIVNNSTTPGAIFAMDMGRKNLTFRNLKLRNNGNLNNANSRVFDMQNNGYSNPALFSPNGPWYRDSSANQYITITNNEIGNASYGIYDVGSVPRFIIGPAEFNNYRNHHNVFSRNDIGSQSYPIGTAGILFTNEDGLRIERNHISWVVGPSVYTTGMGANSVAGIAMPEGNSVNTLVNGNKIHNITGGATGNTLGIALLQASTIYTQGPAGPNQKRSALPVVTANQVANNFVYDLRAPQGVLNIPIFMATATSTYTTEQDKIYNNSISVSDALAGIDVWRSAKPFLYNNIIQITNTHGTPNNASLAYYLAVPRPWALDISSDYNLFDLENPVVGENFAQVVEYDRVTGTFIQQRNIPTLNDWRTLTGQDIHSVTGNPMFTGGDLHLPPATSYIISPASNAGTWFDGTLQRYDVDGDERLLGSDFADIGADEFEGFQYMNDLGVQVIMQPSGITNSSGTTIVADENPFNIQAIVKNFGGIVAMDRNVYARIDYSTNNGLTWLTLWSAAPKNLDFAVNESKVVDFSGATITNMNYLYRAVVWVDNDQNNANNILTKTFQALIKREAVLVSYESSSARGLENKDSVVRALNRLGVRYDLLDRTSFGTNDIDYTPWWTLIWSTGNPTTAYNGTAGLGAVSLKEQEELIRFLRAGENWAKKSLIIAGSNIAEYNDPTSPYAVLNNPVTDLEFMRDWMHTRYVARHPGLNWPTSAPVQYRGLLKGDGVYFLFNDSLSSVSPDVIRREPVTGPVGEQVSRQAYSYQPHSATPLDSTAGVAWTQPDYNVVFYAFDWADPIHTPGFSDAQGSLASGTTRVLRGALDFIQSFRGTVLPVEFVDVKGTATKRGNELTWEVANQTEIDRYEIELYDGANWAVVGDVKASETKHYSFTDSRTSAFAITNFVYRVASVGLDGSRGVSKSVTVGRSATGLDLVLDQNFPNPFGEVTKIGFTLPEGGLVTVRVLDMTGKTVRTEVTDVAMAAGQQQIDFRSEGLASGSYIYELSFTNAAGQTSRLVKTMKISK